MKLKSIYFYLRHPFLSANILNFEANVMEISIIIIISFMLGIYKVWQ